MNKSSQVIIGVVAVVVLAAIIFFSQPSSPTGLVVSNSSSHIDKISLAYVPSPINTVPIVALRKGFFAEEGLQVEEVKASFMGYVIQQVVDSKIDLLTGAETAAMFVALKGGNFTILAKHATTVNDLQIVARKDAHISSIKDLVGKKIGFSFTSTPHYQIWRLLKENNIDPSKVTFVDTAPQNMASALSHGDLDAIFGWEPTPSKIIAGLGESVTHFTPETSYVMNLYASPKFSSNTEVQKKVIRALLKADQFTNEHPQEAIAIVAKETALDYATLEKVWPVWHFGVEEFTQAQLMHDEANWAISAHLTNATVIPDFQAMVNSEAIKAVLAEPKTR